MISKWPLPVEPVDSFAKRMLYSVTLPTQVKTQPAKMFCDWAIELIASSRSCPGTSLNVCVIIDFDRIEIFLCGWNPITLKMRNPGNPFNPVNPAQSCSKKAGMETCLPALFFSRSPEIFSLLQSPPKHAMHARH